MLGVTLFGIFLTPVFYVLLRARRSRRLERAATAPPVQAAPQPSGGAGE